MEDRRTEKQKDGRLYVCMYGQTDGRADVRIYTIMYVRTGGWISGWVGGWVQGRINLMDAGFQACHCRNNRTGVEQTQAYGQTLRQRFLDETLTLTLSLTLRTLGQRFLDDSEFVFQRVRHRVEVLV